MAVNIYNNLLNFFRIVTNLKANITFSNESTCILSNTKYVFMQFLATLQITKAKNVQY